MRRYRVVDIGEAGRCCALRCDNGRHHLARFLGGLPRLDASLSGARPHLGFGELVCRASGMKFRVIFESINLVQLPPGATPDRAAAARVQPRGG